MRNAGGKATTFVLLWSKWTRQGDSQAILKHSLIQRQSPLLQFHLTAKQHLNVKYGLPYSLVLFAAWIHQWIHCNIETYWHRNKQLTLRWKREPDLHHVNISEPCYSLTSLKIYRTVAWIQYTPSYIPKQLRSYQAILTCEWGSFLF